MPIYEYRCLNCGERFEKLVRSSEDKEEIVCPVCQSDFTERLPSASATLGFSSRNLSGYRSFGGG